MSALASVACFEDLVLAQLDELTSAQARFEKKLDKFCCVQADLGSFASAVAHDAPGFGSACDATVEAAMEAVRAGDPEKEPQQEAGSEDMVVCSNRSLQARILDKEVTVGIGTEGSDDKMSVDFVASTLTVDWPAVLKPRAVFADLGGSAPEMEERGSLWDRSLSRLITSSEPVADRSVKSSHEQSCWAINPNSNFHLAYSVLSLVVLMSELTMIPYTLAWDVESTGFLAITAWTTPAFWTGDMCISFLTGFYYHGGDLEMDLRMIARRYLRTWFTMDILVVVGDWGSAILDSLDHGALDGKGGLKMLRFTKMGRFGRILGMLRMLRLMRLLEDFADRYLSQGYILALRILSLAASIFWGNHVLACIWFAVGAAELSDTGVTWMDQAGFITNGEYVHYLDAGGLYQYTTAFQWASAQMALGGVDVQPTNSMERITTVLAMMIGFLFGSTVISMLSAGMVDYQMMQKEKKQRLRSLMCYMRENNVDKALALRVQKQAKERLDFRERLSEEDVPVLAMLSSALRSKLRFEIQQPHLLRHPLLRLWANVNMSLTQRICSKAVDFAILRPKDDLFLPATVAEDAYCLMIGTLVYMQYPDTSPAIEETSTVAHAGQWLCEAAVWSEWTHVGKAEASTSCQLLVIRVNRLAQMLWHSRIIQDVTAEYSRHFYKRIISARPPDAAWPTDLQVPFTDYCDLVVSMDQEIQVMIGRIAIAQLTDQRRQSGRSAQALLQKLSDEVDSGKSLVVVNGEGVVFRVASIVALRVQREDACIFAQVGKWTGKEMVAGCQLPGGKQERGELLSECARRIFRTKLELIDGKVDILHSSSQIFEKESKYYGVQTRYLRTVCSAKFRASESVDAEVYAPSTPESLAQNQADVVDVAHAGMWQSLREQSVYGVRDEGGVTLFAWLLPDEFDFLSGAAGDAMLKAWLDLISNNIAGSWDVLPHGQEILDTFMRMRM